MSSQADNMIVDGHNFDVNEIVGFNKPRLNKSGGKAIGILNTQTSRQLTINTPLMLTWGVNERIDEKTGRVSYDMALQFPQESYSNDKTRAFLKSMQDFEQFIKTSAVKNSKTWLNKSKVSEDQIDVLFHPMLYWPRDKQTGEIDPDRSPTLKVKLDYWDEKFSCELYDVNGDNIFPHDETALPVNVISKASHVACIIKCGGVWFANGKFGVTWKLVQAVVKPKATISGKCFIKLSTEDKEKIENQSNGGDDDDDDDDNNMKVRLEEDTDEEQEEPEPVVVKTEPVVVKTEPVVVETEPVNEEVTKPKKIVRKKVVRKKKSDK